MSVHSVSMRGKRPQNEDKHNIIINLDGRKENLAPINYYSVCDGHGGKAISKFLSDNLPQCFVDKKVVYPLKRTFVKNVYEYWDNLLKTEYNSIATTAGSTCLVVIHFRSEQDSKEYLDILNTGDSRCVICRNNLGVPLTKDHKPNWPEESVRIRSLGGQIIMDGYDWRICNLSVSRAFGDLAAQPYVTNMPDMFHYRLTSADKFMVLACDGLWDVFCNQDVVNIVLEGSYDMVSGMRINRDVNMAKKLGELAIEKGSCDNISIIIVYFS